MNTILSLRFLATNAVLIGSVVTVNMVYDKQKHKLQNHLYKEGLSDSEINRVVDRTFIYGSKSTFSRDFTK